MSGKGNKIQIKAQRKERKKVNANLTHCLVKVSPFSRRYGKIKRIDAIGRDSFKAGRIQQRIGRRTEEAVKEGKGKVPYPPPLLQYPRIRGNYRGGGEIDKSPPAAALFCHFFPAFVLHQLVVGPSLPSSLSAPLFFLCALRR